jgi:translation elongation factor EF-Tu-like GTPase
MLSVEARIYLKTEDEGGLTRPGFSGMQPSMDINGELIACKIIDGAEGERLDLGQEHDVRIDLGYGEVFSDVLRSGFKFNLNVGGRVIGNGRIL